MGFSNQERINLFTKSLAAAVYDANATAVWYESKLPFQFILDGEAVWTQVASIPPAGTLATARANALANPTIIQDLSQNVDAVRLTLVAGTNQSTYVAYEIYNDTASPRLGNWILPQLVPQTNGAASNGYAINLYNGDPNAGGVLVSTSAGTTGTGINKTVGWIFNYASGILILADDFKAAITDPWIVGFRYIGETAKDSSGSITGTINPPEVAYATGVDTIGGDASFIYDDTNALLEVEKIKSQYVYEVRNESGATIEAGTCVTLSGVTPSGKTLIIPADASDPTKICKGIVPNQIPDSNNGYVVILGLIHSLDGGVGNHHFDETITTADIGKIIYVSPINPGRITITRPTSPSDFVQSIGCISNITGGSNVTIEIVLSKPNDVPNEFSISGNIDAGSLTVNSAYTFPTTDGAVGQALVTDGSGNLSFAYVGGLVTYVADETLVVGDIVRVANSLDVGFTPGRVVLAGSTNTEGDIVLGIVTVGGNQGDVVSIATSGKVGCGFSVAPPSVDNGKKIYLSSTNGKATTTPPSTIGNVVCKVGILAGADGITTTPLVDIQIQEIMYIG